jgi:hypothetical protein
MNAVILDNEIYREALSLAQELGRSVESADRPVTRKLLQKLGELEAVRQSYGLSPVERATYEWVFLDDNFGPLVGSERTGFFRQELYRETQNRIKAGLPLPADRKMLLQLDSGQDIIVENRPPIAPEVIASLAERNILRLVTLHKALPAEFRTYRVDRSHHFYTAPWKALVTSNVPRDGAWIVDSKGDEVGWIRSSSDAEFITGAANLMATLTHKFGSFSPLDVEQNGIADIFRRLQKLLDILSDSPLSTDRRYSDPSLWKALQRAIEAVEELYKVLERWRSPDGDRPMGHITMSGVKH